MAYTLPPLPYPADALEPSIDKMTMEIHHGRHHKAYVDNLNKALEGHADLPEPSRSSSCCARSSSVPENIRQAVINNGGGHANHTMFWEIMAEGGRQTDRSPGRRHQQDLRRFRSLPAAVKAGGPGPLRQRLGLAGPRGRQAPGPQHSPTRTART